MGSKTARCKLQCTLNWDVLFVESFLIWSLTNTTKCSAIFISFLWNFMRNFYLKLRYFYWIFWILLAQLLIGALLLLKFHNYDRAILIRCATFIRYRRVIEIISMLSRSWWADFKVPWGLETHSRLKVLIFVDSDYTFIYWLVPENIKASDKWLM